MGRAGGGRQEEPRRMVVGRLLLVLAALLGSVGWVQGTTTTTTAASTTASRAAEALSNEVTVVFYLMSKSAFAEKRDLFRQTMAAAANAHCRSYHSVCGLNSDWHQTETFSMTDVEISSESDSVQKSRLHVKYFVSLPRSVPSTKTQYILNKDAVSNSVSGAKDEFYKAVGYSIIQAGTITLSPIPGITVNAIMIAIVLVITFVLIAIVIGCEMRRNKERRNSDRSIKIETYKKTHPLTPQGEVEKPKRPLEDAAYNSGIVYPKPQPQQQTKSEFRPNRDSLRPTDKYHQSDKNDVPPRGQPEQYSRNPQYTSRQPEQPPRYHDYGQYNNIDSREPYSKPQVRTMQVSSYDHQPVPEKPSTDSYYNPQSERAGALAPLTPDEVRKQRKKEKKAKKAKKQEEEDAASAGSRGIGLTPTGYENGSYDNNEARRLARPSSGRPYGEKVLNIPLNAPPNVNNFDGVSFASQDAGRSRTTNSSVDGRSGKYRDTEESDDSGLNSTVTRSAGSGLYRSTDV